MSQAISISGAQPAQHPYRVDHVSFKTILGDMRFSRKSLKPGDSIPNIDVFDQNGRQLKLQDLYKDKPLLLVTGSMTCPVTVSSIPSLSDFQAKLGDKVNIVLVYVREAHPGESAPQPQSLKEKISHARQLQELYAVDFPVVVDGIDGELHQALDIMPNSAHLIGTDGVLMFRSLFSTDHAAVERALAAVSKGEAIKKTQSQNLLTPLVRAAGYMQSAFDNAGPRAHKEMMISALPVYLWWLISSLFSFVPEKRRGVFGLFTMMGIAAALMWVLWQMQLSALP